MTHGFIPNPPLRSASALDVLRLIRSEGVGPMTFFQLVKFAGSVAKAIELAPDMSRRGGRKKPITITPKAAAERELEALTTFGAEVLLYGQERYPRLLQFIPDAPPLITVKGHTYLFTKNNLIGMVGARNASANGCVFAKKLSADLGAAGQIVVSGLARGIDAAAHKGAMATGTIAVIGGGINNVYPPENASLFDEIAATGAIISELPFGAEPHARSFPGRNRIIAGMCRGVAVIEASLKSGSLITAEYANDYGREVFAVPGSPMDPRCHGTNKLLREGATMVESARDILNNLSPTGELPLAEPDAYLPLLREEDAPEYDERTIDSAREEVLQALGASPTQLEDLLATTALPPQVLMAVLLELELADRIERHDGSRVSLNMELS